VADDAAVRGSFNPKRRKWDTELRQPEPTLHHCVEIDQKSSGLLRNCQWDDDLSAVRVEVDRRAARTVVVQSSPFAVTYMRGDMNRGALNTADDVFFDAPGATRCDCTAMGWHTEQVDDAEL
jgi:hypothetical protein